MIAQIWERYVSDSFVDAIHGGSHLIQELYVPELNFAINKVACFFNPANPYAPHKGETLPANLPSPRLVREIELTSQAVELIHLMANGRKAYDDFIKTDVLE